MWLLTFFYKKTSFQWGRFDTEALSFLSADLISYPESSSGKVPVSSAGRRWVVYTESCDQNPWLCAHHDQQPALWFTYSQPGRTLNRDSCSAPVTWQKQSGGRISSCPNLLLQLLQLLPQLWPWAVPSMPLLCCLCACVHFSSFSSVLTSFSNSKFIIRFIPHGELCSLCPLKK